MSAHLTEQQKQAYWRYNSRLTLILIAIWFVAGYLLGGLFAGSLNEFTFLGFPLGYYIAAQGALVVFVLEILVYSKLMNKKDEEYGLTEDGK